MTKKKMHRDKTRRQDTTPCPVAALVPAYNNLLIRSDQLDLKAIGEYHQTGGRIDTPTDLTLEEAMDEIGRLREIISGLRARSAQGAALLESSQNRTVL